MSENNGVPLHYRFTLALKKLFTIIASVAAAWEPRFHSWFISTFWVLFPQILVHLGLLTKESGFKIAENAFSGGPLGELVQWSDLITTLYLLGHDVRISASLAELKESVPSASS